MVSECFNPPPWAVVQMRRAVLGRIALPLAHTTSYPVTSGHVLISR